MHTFITYLNGVRLGGKVVALGRSAATEALHFFFFAHSNIFVVVVLYNLYTYIARHSASDNIYLCFAAGGAETSPPRQVILMQPGFDEHFVKGNNSLEYTKKILHNCSTAHFKLKAKS